MTPLDLFLVAWREGGPILVVFWVFGRVGPNLLKQVGTSWQNRRQIQDTIAAAPLTLADKLLDAQIDERERHEASETALRQVVETFGKELLGLKTSIDHQTKVRTREMARMRASVDKLATTLNDALIIKRDTP